MSFEMMENQNTVHPDQGVSYAQTQNQDQQVSMEKEINLVQLQEREAALRKLENDIVDVNTIFKDLAVMVHDQGEVIDSIESNVESVQISVHHANQDLKKAVDYQVSFLSF